MGINLLIVTRERNGERGYGLGKTVDGVAGQLRLRGDDVHYLSAEHWGEHEKKRLGEIERFLRFFTLKSALCGAWAERLLQGWRAGRETRYRAVSHVWFQDPWLVAGFWVYRWTHLSIGDAVRWGVSEHGLGSFGRAVTYDGLHIRALEAFCLRWYERWVLHCAHWVWSPTHSAMEQLQRDFGYATAPRHWSVMGYGAPKLTQLSQKEARTQLGWDKESIYVVSVGRITPAKGMDLVVEAFGYVQQHSRRNIKLVILGDGNRSWLEAVAHRLGIEVSMGFVDDVTPCLFGADIYISGGNVESFGYANLEAICAGLACVVLRGGANEEVCGSGAWIVDALPEPLLRLVEEDEYRYTWQKNALDYGQKLDNWTTIGEKYHRELHN